MDEIFLQWNVVRVGVEHLHKRNKENGKLVDIWVRQLGGIFFTPLVDLYDFVCNIDHGHVASNFPDLALVLGFQTVVDDVPLQKMMDFAWIH